MTFPKDALERAKSWARRMKEQRTSEAQLDISHEKHGVAETPLASDYDRGPAHPAAVVLRRLLKRGHIENHGHRRRGTGCDVCNELYALADAVGFDLDERQRSETQCTCSTDAINMCPVCRAAKQRSETPSRDEAEGSSAGSGGAAAPSQARASEGTPPELGEQRAFSPLVAGSSPAPLPRPADPCTCRHYPVSSRLTTHVEVDSSGCKVHGLFAAMDRPPEARIDLYADPANQCDAPYRSDVGLHLCTMTRGHGGPVHVQVDPVFGNPRWAWLVEACSTSPTIDASHGKDGKDS